MILDTTYLLPLARMKVKADLLKAVAEGRVEGVDLSSFKVSLISLFELQAKASRKHIPAEYVAEAVETILEFFEAIPFYWREIIVEERKLTKLVEDLIDRLILATAIALKEDLVTKDREIRSVKTEIGRMHEVKILSYADLARE
ncbi:MAG: PIN domain-containing protein [Candidatus Verstraetearchaeota archaeon]|nr:PIN domain-containing protein [Candidatus Verstraetearchaeota archaeon]